MTWALIAAATLVVFWIWLIKDRADHYERLWLLTGDLLDAQDDKHSADMKRLYVELQRTSLALVAMTRERDKWRNLWKETAKPLPPALTDCLKNGDRAGHADE